MQVKKIAILSIISLFILFVFSVFTINKNTSHIEKTETVKVRNKNLTNEEKSIQKQNIAENYGKIPISFEPNKGQTGEQVKFLANGTNYSMFLTDKEAVISLRAKEDKKVKSANVRMQLQGANDSPKSYGIGETSSKTNYFIGNDPDKWQTDVANFEKVKYEKIYDGVDLVYYGNQRQLEYDFVISPNADPNQVKLKISGVKDAKIDDKTGDLLLETEVGEIRQHKPFSYQMIDGEQKEIASLYKVHSPESNVQSPDGKEFVVSFKIAKYDKSKELVIDPILVYGSYLGGSEHDRGEDITIDAQGNAYVIGSGSSRDFPTTAGVIKPELLPRSGTTNSFWSDAFVTKINADGTAIIFSTYLGGRNGGELGGGIGVDDQGNVYLSGTTQSADFPLVNAYRSTVDGPEDAFATKLNPTGSAIIYSTYLGGNNTDSGGRIALNKTTGEATFVGRTISPDFSTTPGALKERLCDSPQTCSGIFYSASYLARFAANGDVLFATLFDARLNDVALDQNENIVVGGSGGNNSLITEDAYQPKSTGSVEGYLGKINAAGNQILYGTYLGGGLESDVITGVILDSAQNIYVTGQTENAGFPTTPGAFDTTFNGSGTLEDGFLTKFNADGSALVYSTFLGGGGKDEPKDIALGSDDSVFIVGETTGSSSFPLRNSITNSGTMFLTHFNADASDIVYSTLLGPIQGSGGIYAVAVDAGDNAYVTGKARSIPVTPGAFQPANGSGGTFHNDDAFVMKIGPADENATYYSISGDIIDENKGFGGSAPAVITISGAINRSVTIVGGQYYFGNLPAGGNYTVSVSVNGFEVSPESIDFNNLGANQFADFTILRNRKPVSVITTPEHHTNFDIPATINIQATASDPDEDDTISKIEFVAYKDGIAVPIGTDTTAPYEVTWENVTETGTWSIYAYPYDNHGLRGDSTPVVHIFVNDPTEVSIEFTNPINGQEYQAHRNFPISFNVSSSVNRVEVRNQDDELVAFIRQAPWEVSRRVSEVGSLTLTAKAFNSEGESVAADPVTISIIPFNAVLSGVIIDDVTRNPLPGINVNLTGTNDISAQSTTDQNGRYTFTDLGGTSQDSITITPTGENYIFEPANRSLTLFNIDRDNLGFVAVEQIPIMVEMTSPTNGQQFPFMPDITLAADASSDGNTITKVEFLTIENGQPVLIAEDTTAPYSFLWEDVPGDSYRLFARAYDDAGGVKNSDDIFISVADEAPVIRLQGDVTNSAGGFMQGVTVRLTGTANGQTIDQTSVSNFFGAYGFFNLPSGGDYTITPDTSTGLEFNPESFSVTNATEDQADIDFQATTNNQAPTVVINNPTDGATFTMPVTIQVQATANDPDGEVTHFTVSADGNGRLTRIGEVNNGNFDIPWQPSAPGEYTLYAVARDNGTLRTTESITVTINPPAPVSISGRIVDRNSNGIPLVTMTLDNTSDTSAEDITVLTDVNGNYTIPNITTFNNYRLTASKLNMAFTPNYRNYFAVANDQTNGDFTGTLQLQPSDFDGDGGSDLAVWRPSNGVWHLNRSNDGYTSIQFGGESFGDVAVPGNYDGDSKIDIAVYRNGVWYIQRSSDEQVLITQLGTATDKPVSGDYDGDGKTDIAVWRPTTGVWYIYRSSDQQYDIRQFGQDGDIPLIGDYDGDGKTDLTVWRPSTGVWYVLQSTDGNFRASQFGRDGDIPLVGDFDGDNIADYTIYRPETGVWYVLRSSDSVYTIIQWGISTDIPVPGDFDKDGKTDFGVFRKTEGNWYIYKSSDNTYLIEHFGLEGDMPIPAAYN